MAQWYYGENGAQIGPLDEMAMRAAIGQGRVNAQTLVWRDGMENWTALSNVPELSVVYAGNEPGNPGGSVYYGPGVVPIGKTSGLAVASMVCGIVGWVSCMFFLGLPTIAAVICGHMALGAIQRSPFPLGGRGMAISGLVMGYLMILTWLGFIIAGIITSITN